jgi:hypothetical protein
MLRQQGRRELTGSQTIRYTWQVAPKERGVPACLSYIVEGDRIRLPGKPGGVRFSFPIGDLIETEQAIVVCLVVPEGKSCSENVYAIDHDGNLLWRVKPRTFEGRSGPYVALSSQGNFIRLHGRDGRRYDLDPRTGAHAERR